MPVILALVAVLSLTRLGGTRAVSAGQVAGLVAIVLVAWLPWLLPMLGAWADADLARTSLVRHAALSELAGALSQYASGTGALLERVRPLQVIGLVVGGALLVRGWVVGGAPERGGLRVITVTTALYFFVPWLISAITGLWLFVAHMMLFVLPAVAVVLAAGALVRDAPLRAVAPAAAAILIAAQVWGLAVNAANPPHGDDGSRDLAVALAARYADDQPVLIVPNEQQIIFERYWGGPLAALPADLDMRRLYRVADPTATWPRSSSGSTRRLAIANRRGSSTRPRGRQTRCFSRGSSRLERRARRGAGLRSPVRAHPPLSRRAGRAS